MRSRCVGLRGDPSVCRASGASVLGLLFFKEEGGIRDLTVTGVQTCALPISPAIPRNQTPARRRSTTILSIKRLKIGRASCRERGEISVVAVSLKKTAQ